jgi:hypothetical protein
MDEIRLPHHIVDRLERRWTGRFAQIMNEPQHPTTGISCGGDDPIRSPQVRRLLEGSLRPPEARSSGSAGVSGPAGVINDPLAIL